MRFKDLSTLFKSNGHILKDFNGRQRTLVQFEAVCKSQGIKIDRNCVEEEYLECARELAKAAPEKSAIEIVKDSLNVKEIFQDFEKREDGRSSPILRYVNPVSGIFYTLGSLDDFNEYRKVVKSLLNYGQETLDNWIDMLTPHTPHLKIASLTETKAAEYMWETIFTGPSKIKTKRIDPEAFPMVLDGFGRKGDKIIPFTRKVATLDDLHPVLGGFLRRVEYHKYLCAILASTLLGFTKEYTPYLYGAGGDGKTTFTTFLDMAVDHSTGILDLSDKAYGLYNCVDKVFLFIHDTSNSRVFFYEEYKKITGRDAVKVNAKYQHPRDMKLPGTVIVTSNQMPDTCKDEWFTRRVRIFNVAKMEDNKGKRVDTHTAAMAMLSTVNEFWNYCIQCLEELGNINTGEIQDLPNARQSVDNSESPEDEYEDFLIDIKLDINPELSISGYSFRKKVETKATERGKDQFFTRKFIDYLRRSKGVTRDGNCYIGIGSHVQASNGGTKFVGKAS